MLYNFKINNYKSILDLELKLDFAEGKAPNGYDKLEMMPFLSDGNKSNRRFAPIFSIYGANASGKTNIISAMINFRNLVCESHEVIKFSPNKLNNKFEHTGFEVGILEDSVFYSYCIKYNESGIIEEKLLSEGKLVFEINNNELINCDKLLKENYDKKFLNEKYNVECKSDGKNQTRTFLKVISKNYSGLSPDIVKIYNCIKDKFSIYLNNNFNIYSAIDKLLKSKIYENKNDCLKNIADFIRKFDIGIRRIDFRIEIDEINKLFLEQQDEKNTINNPSYDIGNVIKNSIFCDNLNFYHDDIKGEEIEFKLSEESQGTKLLIGIISMCLYALNKGSMLVIDELERSLHPSILKEITHLFKSKRYNKNNAQLIFTTHNADFLEDEYLRVSEVGIIDKTLKSGSTLKRISDFENIRNINNFRKKYLEGEFSGIPFAYI